MTYVYEFFCAYRCPGRIKHTTCSFDYSCKFLRNGRLKFHDLISDQLESKNNRIQLILSHHKNSAHKNFN